MTNQKDFKNINLSKLVDDLDSKIYHAIRQAYGYGEESELLTEHWLNTQADAASYFGSFIDRSEQMYALFDYARFDDMTNVEIDVDKLLKNYQIAK